MLKVSELQEEVAELQQDLSELQHDFTLAIEELAATQESVEHMTSQLNDVLLERREIRNTGKAYDDLSSRQKLSQFQRAADAALWFGESFGLVPAQLIVQSSLNDESLIIPLGCIYLSSSSRHTTCQGVDEFLRYANTIFSTDLVYRMNFTMTLLKYVFVLLKKNTEYYVLYVLGLMKFIYFVYTRYTRFSNYNIRQRACTIRHIGYMQGCKARIKDLCRSQCTCTSQYKTLII